MTNAIFQRCIGATIESRPIIARANFDFAAAARPANVALFIGGMHGDEKATVLLLESFCEKLLAALRPPVIVLPLANPDGYERHSRYNARGVDLNRNCDTNWHANSAEPSGVAPWSEPESRALRDFILEFEPAKIVSLHWALAEIDADGAQSTGLARRMWEAMNDDERKPYRIRVAEAGRGLRRLAHTYEICPGSLGQWCGYGLEYPNKMHPAMITLELPFDPLADSRPHPLPDGHLAGLHRRWRADSAAYLGAVESGAHKMLLAACWDAER
jgi:hypothetical protein